MHWLGDSEIIEAAQAFMYACMQSYIGCIKLRSKMYKRGEVKAPQPHNPLGRTTILEFFEACTAYSKG